MSHLKVNLLPYCDDTNRAAGLRGWLSRLVASGARATSCSHSRFEGRNYRHFFPTLPFTAARARFRLEGAAGNVRPFKGVSSIVAHFGFRSVQFSCSALTTFSVLAMRGCSEGGSSEDSVATWWRWAWRVTTRWRARPPLMLTLQKVSEPPLQWKKGTNEFWVPLWVSRTFFLCVSMSSSQAA